MLLEKGHHMEASRRYRQHATRWQGPGPGEDVDDAVHEAFNRMCNDMGKQFFPAQLNLARTQRDELLAVVTLYKSLGGGWQENR